VQGDRHLFQVKVRSKSVLVEQICALRKDEQHTNKLQFSKLIPTQACVVHPYCM